MTTAIEKLAQLETSAEAFLEEAIPVLQQFREYHANCLRENHPLAANCQPVIAELLNGYPEETQAVMEGNAATAATKLRGVIMTLLGLLDKSATTTENQPVPPSSDIATTLDLLDEQDVASWNPDSEKTRAYSRLHWDTSKAAAEEHDAESRITKRAAFDIDTDVTFLTVSGAPVGQNRITERIDDDRLRCADGTILKFHDISGGHWGFEPEEKSKSSEDPFVTRYEAKLSRSTDKAHMAVVRGLMTPELGRANDQILPWAKTMFVAQGKLWDAGEKVIGVTDLFQVHLLLSEVFKKANYATLLAYMMRRFGPPFIHDGDDYKSMTGAWCLTTPKPDLFVIVSPNPSGLPFSFQILAYRETEKTLIALKEAHSEEFYDHPERTEATEAYLQAFAPYSQALRGLFLDLLRPVWVRDVPINIEGRLRDSSPLCAYIESADFEGYVHGTEYAKNATYALRQGVLQETAALDRLLNAANRLTQGDYGTALTKAAELLEETGKEQAATKPAGQ